MYPKITFPVKTYQHFDKDYCKMTFEYPIYSRYEQDLNYFDEKPVDPCWFNIQFDDFKGTLHCSYIPIKNRTHFDQLVDESFRMVEEHNSKANSRKEVLIKNIHGVSGLYFTLTGKVATNMQFVLTDTTEHFFRGSLYFNSRVQPDSIRPIFNFVSEDIDYMIETFQWQ
jgi:gliding motility-associated lipoprotein GldD